MNFAGTAAGGIAADETLEAEVQELEISIDEAKHAVEAAQMAQRLFNNADFRKVIVEGYFRDEAARLAMVHAEPSLRPDIQAAIMNDMKGPGALKRYLSHMVQRGFAAENEIVKAREAIFELRTGDTYQSFEE